MTGLRKLNCILLVIAIYIFTACSYNVQSGGKASTDTKSGELYVFAAASLSGVFKEVAKEFEEAEKGEVDVILNFAGSQALVTSIMSGAEADVFASADMANMQKLEEKGLVKEYAVFAGNRLALVASRGSKYKISSIEDLGVDGLKLAVADKSVPVGAYWEKAAAKAQEENLMSQELWARIEKNTVTRELNVKDVLSKVILNEADAGIVYRTDAASADEEKIAEVPVPFFNSITVEYPAAVLTESKSRYSQKLLDYILSDKGQGILKNHGFVIP